VQDRFSRIPSGRELHTRSAVSKAEIGVLSVDNVYLDVPNWSARLDPCAEFP
jgi:hypothetical protein